MKIRSLLLSGFLLSLSFAQAHDWTCGYAEMLGVAPEALMWKKDQFPSLHKKVLQEAAYNVPMIEGAPNYRPSRSTAHLFGSALPTVAGLHNVLATLHNDHVLWINLREEVVLYFSGASFNLRKKDKPFMNISLPGISSEKLTSLEDCMALEIKTTHAPVELFDEDTNMQVIPSFAVDFDNIETTGEVFSQESTKQPSLSYLRIPMTDEKSANMDDLLEIVQAVKDERRSHPNAALAFNCHAGRGRTTQGMITASLALDPHLSVDALVGVEGHLKNLKTDIEKAKSPEEKAEYIKRLDTLYQLKKFLFTH